MYKEYIKSLLAKQALWKVHKPLPKEIHHPHHDVTKPNEQHQFDLVHMPHDMSEGNTYKHLLTGIDLASRYKVGQVPYGQKIKRGCVSLGSNLKVRWRF